MEGTGWQAVLAMRELYNRGEPIPFVNLRAAADYTHAPVQWDKGITSDDQSCANVTSVGPAWRETEAWLPSESQQAAFMAIGYQHAIRTSSALLLHVFRLRQDGNRPHNVPSMGRLLRWLGWCTGTLSRDA